MPAKLALLAERRFVECRAVEHDPALQLAADLLEPAALNVDEPVAAADGASHAVDPLGVWHERISVSRSRLERNAFAVSSRSSSARHEPSFGCGGTVRS